MTRNGPLPAKKLGAEVSSAPLVLQRKCGCGQHTGGGECEQCKKKGMTLQRQARGSAVSGPVPPIVRDVLNSPGRPLDPDTRAFMEPRFGQDLSQVRVHTDAKAADSADAVHARAYTVGRNIVFGPGQYPTQGEASRHLLAHELTHVVQQNASGVGADSETRANAAADRISQGKAVDEAAVGGAPVSMQRSPKDDAAGKTGAVVSARNSTEPPVDEFDFDKTNIPPQHLARLADLRMRLVQAPSATVILTGHTDTVGKEKYNEDLGRRRAKAVRDFLSAKKGVNPSRIEIKTRGELEAAAGQPPAKGDPDKGEKNPKNRRVEIQVIGLPSTDSKTDLPSGRPTAPDKGDSGKKKPDFRLPPDYDPGPPSSGRDTGTSSTSTTTEKKKEGGLQVEGSVVADPNAKPEKGSSRVGRSVETQIEVSYEESTGNRRILPKFSVTLHVGPNGFEEVEAELTVVRQKLKSQILRGTVKNVTFSVSFNPGVNFDKSTANRVIPDFSAKVKAALSADLGIPGTSIKIPVEASVFADPLGKPGGELKITVWTF